MFENVQVYQDILEEITKETDGDWGRMSYSQKLMVINIMKEYKKDIDNYMRNEYYKIKMYASLNYKDIQLEEREPDLTRFRSDEENNFYRLMGGSYE